MRTALLITFASVLLTSAGCTMPGRDGRDVSSYVVVFEVDADASGKLHRLAVARVLESGTERTVLYLPSATYVNRARDALAEKPWPVSYDASGNIKPVMVRCALSDAAPDTPAC